VRPQVNNPHRLAGPFKPFRTRGQYLVFAIEMKAPIGGSKRRNVEFYHFWPLFGGDILRRLLLRVSLLKRAESSYAEYRRPTGKESGGTHTWQGT
jgi:hypothetical protein